MRAMLRRTVARTQVYGYGMLATLLLLMVAHLSFESENFWVELAGLGLSLATIIVASIAVAHTRARLLITPLFALGAIVSNVWDYVAGSTETPELLTVLGQLFFWYVCGCLVIDLLTRWGELATQLVAAICLYIVMAIAFSRAYLLIDEHSPTSAFTTAALIGDEGRLSKADAIYYSFVTQTTLGYGDIAPVSMPARAFATIQATIGVLYIAVIVAAIVGASREQSSRSTTTPTSRASNGA